MKNRLSTPVFHASWLALGVLAIVPRSAYAQATHVAQDWANPAVSAPAPGNGLREFLPRLRSALDSANKNPEQQQPLKFSANVTAESRTGIRRLRIRNFQFLSDGGLSAGEYNLGPGSWPTIVGVLGSSVAQDYLIQAAKRGIPLDSLEVVFTSTPGPAPSWTGRTITYPRELAYTAYIASPASDARLEELREVVERESAVLNLVREKQDIPHAELVYTQTPRDRSTEIAGLREFLEAKRAASQRRTPPSNESQAAPSATVAQSGAGTPATGEANRPGEGRRRRNANAETRAAALVTPTVGANENAPLRAVVKVEGSTGIRNIRIDSSNFQLIHDFPTYLGGHNLGPVAEEHILGVMTTCLTHIFENQAASQGVALDSLRLETEGTLTPRVGSTNQSPRFSNIRYRAYIGSPESEETVAKLVEAVEGVCPIYNLLRNANQVSGRVVRGPYREPVRTAAP